MRIAIVTDSTADIPQALADSLKIKIIPLAVHFNGKAYFDRVDLTNEDFYNYIGTAKTLPTTSQPSPAQYVDVYRACREEGAERILSIHISSEMSGTCQGARLAAEMVKDEVAVEVVDSRTVTIGLGLQVVTMAQFVRDHPNATWDEVMARMQTAVERTRIYFLLDTLDNLQKGGRIGKASYLVGSILNIKPILVVEDGVISVHEKLRSKKIEKAISHLVNVVDSFIDPEKNLYFTLGYNSEDYLHILENGLEPKLQTHAMVSKDQLQAFQLGCVVTTHIGLGAVGIAYYQL